MLVLRSKTYGLIQRNNLRIGITSLGMQDKLRVQAVLKDKYGLTSSILSSGTYLAIHDVAK
jgi:hypothetical protein